jgi:hypothetical protein
MPASPPVSNRKHHQPKPPPASLIPSQLPSNAIVAQSPIGRRLGEEKKEKKKRQIAVSHLTDPLTIMYRNQQRTYKSKEAPLRKMIGMRCCHAIDVEVSAVPKRLQKVRRDVTMVKSKSFDIVKY